MLGIFDGLVDLNDFEQTDLPADATDLHPVPPPAGLDDCVGQAVLAPVVVDDHDATASAGQARAAPGGALEVIAGVEITAEFRGLEVHLLGYFVRPDDPALATGLADLRTSRRARLIEMARRLRSIGPDIEGEVTRLPETAAVG